MTSTPEQPGDQSQPPPDPYGSPPPPAGSAPPPPPGPAAPGQPYGQAPGYSTPAAQMSPSDEKTWSMLAHLGGIILGFLAPLIIWLVFKDRGPFVKHHATEALNFQIALLIANIVAAILWVIGVGVLLTAALYIANIVFCILAGLAANRGEWYRYPVSLRLIS